MWTWPGPPSQKVTGPDEGEADLERLFFFNVVKEGGHHMLRRWNVISKAQKLSERTTV